MVSFGEKDHLVCTRVCGVTLVQLCALANPIMACSPGRMELPLLTCGKLTVEQVDLCSLELQLGSKLLLLFFPSA